MATSKRSSKPLPDVNHGLSGYGAGCGCWICTKANSDRKAEQRERRRLEGIVKRVAPDAGAQEKLTRIEILELGKLTKEGDSLAHLAIINARLIDHVEEEGKWHLLSTTVRTLREIMKELRAAVQVGSAGDRGKEEEPDDFASTLRSTG